MSSEYPEIPQEEKSLTCPQPEDSGHADTASEMTIPEAMPQLTDETGPAAPKEPENAEAEPELPAIAAPEPEVPAEPEVLTEPEAPVQPDPIVFTVNAPQPHPEQKPAKAKKQRRKPHIALRIPLQLLSLVLSIVMFVTLLAGIVLADLRQLMSSGGIKQLISALLTPTSSAPAVIQPIDRAPLNAVSIDTDATDSGNVIDDNDFTVDEDGNISIGGGSSIDLGEIPDDILTGGGSDSNVNALVNWLYEQIDESTDEQLKMTKEEMQSFVEKSTVSDFLADKLAAYADDFINGTENASITAEEIMALLEENEDLLESELNIELTREYKEQLTTSIEKIVDENDLDTTIRDTVYETVDKVLEENADVLGGVTLEDVQQSLQTVSSDGPFYSAVGVFVVLLLLLCLANFYNVPAGLTWASFPCIFAGGLMSLPIMLLQNSTDVVTDLMPELAGFVNVLSTFVDLLAPIHYGVLITGVALLVISIIWRIIRTVVRKSRLATV